MEAGVGAIVTGVDLLESFALVCEYKCLVVCMFKSLFKYMIRILKVQLCLLVYLPFNPQMAIIIVQKFG